MGRVRRGALLAISSLVVAACLPTRDNGDDPAIRPDVSIELATSEIGPGGNCLPADDVASQVTRSQCLTVRATGTDPQGDEEVVGYAFSLLSTDGATTFVRVPVTGLGSALSATFDISSFAPDVLRSSTRYDVKVEVVDVDGHFGEERERFLIRNTPPVAVAPGARLVPHWGGAWRTGDAYPVNLTLHFSGAASHDPDGDALTYTWLLREAPAGTAELNASSFGVASPDPVLSLVVPADPDVADGVLLELQVSDGQLTDRVVATAQLDASPAWAVQEGTGKALILDVNRAPLDLPLDHGGLGAFIWNPGNLLASAYLFRNDNGNVLDKLNLATGARDQVALDGGILGIYPVGGAATWFWAVSAPTSGGLRAYVIDAETMSILAFADEDELVGIFETSFGAVDPVTGALWFGQLGSLAIDGWTYDEQAQAISLLDRFEAPSGRLITGLALRRPPGEDVSQLWFVVSRDIFTGGSPEPLQLVAVREPGAAGAAGEPYAVNVFYPLAFNLTATPDLGFSLEWATSETAWLNLFGVGMASFELCGPQGAEHENSLCLATLAADFPSAFDFVMNRKTGTTLGIGLDNHTLGRIAIDGTYSLLESESTIEGLIGPDPGGRIWTVIRGNNNGSVIHRGNGAGLDGIVVRAPIGLGFGKPSIDFSTGDLWAPSLFPSGAVRYYSDGRVADAITGVSGPDAQTRFNLLPGNVTAPDPETGNLWILTGGAGSGSPSITRVYLADPYAPRIAPGVAPVAAGALNPVLDVGSLFDGEVIAQAVAQVHGNALVMLTRTKKGNAVSGSPCELDTAPLGPGFNYYLRRLSPDGTLFPPASSRGICAVSDFISLNGGDNVELARDIVTGQVCVAARQLAGPQGALIARYGTNLTPVFRGVVPASSPGPAGTFIHDLAAAPGQCWVGTNENDGGTQEGRLILVEPGAGPLSPRITLSSLALDLPEITTVRPTISSNVAETISGAARAWVGGNDDAPLVPIIYTTGTFGLATAVDSMPVTFATEFVQP